MFLRIFTITIPVRKHALQAIMQSQPLVNANHVSVLVVLAQIKQLVFHAPKVSGMVVAAQTAVTMVTLEILRTSFALYAVVLVSLASNQPQPALLALPL